MTRLKQAWLALLERRRMRKVGRAMAKAWREATGGSCRYVVHMGGSRMEFSAPECRDLETAAKVLRDAAALIEAMPKPKIAKGKRRNGE